MARRREEDLELVVQDDVWCRESHGQPESYSGVCGFEQKCALMAGAVRYILGGCATAWLDDQSRETLVGWSMLVFHC
jgi:hypothetical protein